MEVADTKAAKAPSRARSSSSNRPSVNQMKRTIRDLRDDVDSLYEDLAQIKRQMLWTMSQNISGERREAAQQVILQGFLPRQERADMETAIKQRDLFVAELCKSLSRSPSAMVCYTVSHTMTATSMSRISLVTFENPSLAAAMVAASGQRKFPLDWHPLPAGGL